MTWKLEDSVTSLEDSKRLAESGIELEADSTYISEDGKHWTLLLDAGDNLIRRRGWHHYSAYRLDKLLSLLPDWCFNYDPSVTLCDHIVIELDLLGKLKPGTDFFEKFWDLEIEYLQTGRGQPSIKSCVDLLILLKEEGLLND